MRSSLDYSSATIRPYIVFLFCKLLTFSHSKKIDVGNFDRVDNCLEMYASKQYNSCITDVLHLTYCISDHTKEKTKAPSLCNFSGPLLDSE